MTVAAPATNAANGTRILQWADPATPSRDDLVLFTAAALIEGHHFDAAEAGRVVAEIQFQVAAIATVNGLTFAEATEAVDSIFEEVLDA